MSNPPLRSVVTGCSGALGGAVVEALLRRGDRLVGLDRSRPKQTQTQFVPVDLADAASVIRAIDEAADILGGIDVLVHAAGIMRTSNFLETTDEDVQEHLNVNLLGAFRVIREVARKMMDDGGRIVIITSLHGRIGVPQRTAYAASKGGLEAMGRVAAAELAPHRIRVNMLAPGAVAGGMQPNPASRAHWVDATPAHRVAMPQEVASAAALLTSDDASFINGQTIAIDGGASNLRAFGIPPAE